MEKIELILADFPWHFASRKAGGETKSKTKFGGGAQKHYPDASQFRSDLRESRGYSDKKLSHSLLYDKELLEVCHEVSQVVADDAIMFHWCTMATLEFGMQCLKECGFKYKTTAFSWFKLTNDGTRLKFGPGYYSASNLEVCLLGKRGKGLGPCHVKMQPSVIMFEDDVDEYVGESVILSPRGKHSEKPQVHHAIDNMYPNRNKLELFAREFVSDWPAIGIEITGNDILQDLAEIKERQENGTNL